MAISPFLQMLLSKKRPDFAPISQFPDEEPPPAPGPTIPIQSQSPAIVPAQPQQPSIPMGAEPAMEGFGKVPALNPQSMTGPMSALPEPSAPTIPLKLQSRVEGAADEVRKYDQGLHKDPKTGEWVEHKRNKGLQILEGLGNFAASGIGLNLQGLLHPRGTPEQQARRALRTEVGLQDQDIQRRGAEANITRDEAYAKKLGEPEKLTANSKYVERADGVYEISAAHPEGRKVSGIPGEVREAKDAAGFSLSPGEARFDHTGKLIVEREPKPDKASGETQEEADKREAERQSLKTAADTAKGYADHVDKSLLPPLYKQRGEVKAELDGTNWTKKAADEGEPAAKTRKEALTAQLAELKSQISTLEKDRNDHNSTAGSKAAEALKFERKPKAEATSPAQGMGMSRKTFRANNPATKGKSNKEIDAIISGAGYTPLP